MAKVDVIYHNIASAIIDYGYWYNDSSRDKRCKQISHMTVEIPLDEFPLLTTKKMFTKGIVGELIWFLRGDNNTKYLNDNGITIWDKDAANYSNNGDVGRNYGVQWRDWNSRNYNVNSPNNFNRIDQIANLLKSLKEKPINRRNIVTAWNPGELHETALPPCHWAWEIIPRPLFQYEKNIYGLDKEYGFDLKWHQRSVDTFLGLPFNIASYGLLAFIIGELTGFIPLNLIADLSNVHFYEPHIEIVKEQLTRNPHQFNGCRIDFSSSLQQLTHAYRTNNITSEEEFMSNFFNEMQIDDVMFENYQSYGSLKAEMFEPKK